MMWRSTVLILAAFVVAGLAVWFGVPAVQIGKILPDSKPRIHVAR